MCFGCQKTGAPIGREIYGFVERALAGSQPSGWKMSRSLKKTCFGAGNMVKYTCAERDRAAEGRDLVRKLGFRSPQVAKDMLNNGGILNCPLIGADIDRGIDITGRPKGYWKGKLLDTEKLVR